MSTLKIYQCHKSQRWISRYFQIFGYGWWQAERYDEMVEAMKQVSQMAATSELSVEERNLLSVGYKNVIGARRASWRILSSIEQKERSKGNTEHEALIEQYRSKVETELTDICKDILAILDEHLIPASTASESKVFYLKMKGDYFRWACCLNIEFHVPFWLESTCCLAYTAMPRDQSVAMHPNLHRPFDQADATNLWYVCVWNEPSLSELIWMTAYVRRGVQLEFNPVLSSPTWLSWGYSILLSWPCFCPLGRRLVNINTSDIVMFVIYVSVAYSCFSFCFFLLYLHEGCPRCWGTIVLEASMHTLSLMALPCWHPELTWPIKLLLTDTSFVSHGYHSDWQMYMLGITLNFCLKLWCVLSAMWGCVYFILNILILKTT